LFVTLTSGSKILPWKICCIECVKILQDKEFDILYNDMVETDDAIRAWLEVKQKKKDTLIWFWQSSLWQYDDEFFKSF
jgi:hypothetical protein